MDLTFRDFGFGHLTGTGTYFDEPILQEILALTGGGKTREYTETRPDGTTVTYTIDVEEEVIEVRNVNTNVVGKQLNEGVLK